MIFLISNNPKNLAGALAGQRSATIEAEYGDEVVEGSIITMAHHGSRAGQPAPCSYPNGCGKGVEVVGLSHVDLDTIGGCAAILNRKPEAPTFWELAEFVDLNGPHKLAQAGASKEDIRRLYAYWAWSEKNRVFPPRDGSVLDITDKVMESIRVIEQLLSGNEELLQRGDEFKAASERLNAESFIEAIGGVAVRVAGAFANHLYNLPTGEVCEAVVGYDTRIGAIRISFESIPEGISAREIVQSLWGGLAGGHAGIAGSPRNQRMALDDLVAARDATVAALETAK